jgi:hypothetical protein
MKESYENMYLLVKYKYIHYDKYTWHICGGLKMVALLLE